MRVPLSQVALPPGQAFDFGGERADFVKAVSYMSEALSMAVIFQYSILASQFSILLKLIAIMLSLPLSVVVVTGALRPPSARRSRPPGWAPARREA